MKYNNGTISITADSNVIVGNDTVWASTIEVGMSIVIPAIGASYQVSRIISDTEIHLSRNVKVPVNQNANLADLSNLSYAIGSEFTPFMSMPVPTQDDPDKVTFVNRSVKIIESEVTRLQSLP